MHIPTQTGYSKADDISLARNRASWSVHTLIQTRCLSHDNEKFFLGRDLIYICTKTERGFQEFPWFWGVNERTMGSPDILK